MVACVGGRSGKASKGLLHIPSSQVSSGEGTFASKGMASSVMAALRLFMGKTLLVVVDSHSKWPKVLEMNTMHISCQGSYSVEGMSVHYRLLEQVVSDNGSQFTSSEISQFLASNGVKHIRCLPYHPSSNGAAERLVQTVKQALKGSFHKGV